MSFSSKYRRFFKIETRDIIGINNHLDEWEEKEREDALGWSDLDALRQKIELRQSLFDRREQQRYIVSQSFNSPLFQLRR
jgi:hypothetical protein